MGYINYMVRAHARMITASIQLFIHCAQLSDASAYSIVRLTQYYTPLYYTALPLLANPGSVLCFDKTAQHQCIILPIELSRHVKDSVQINKVNLCIK